MADNSDKWSDATPGNRLRKLNAFELSPVASRETESKTILKRPASIMGMLSARSTSGSSPCRLLAGKSYDRNDSKRMRTNSTTATCSAYKESGFMPVASVMLLGPFKGMAGLVQMPGEGGARPGGIVRGKAGEKGRVGVRGSSSRWPKGGLCKKENEKLVINPCHRPGEFLVFVTTLAREKECENSKQRGGRGRGRGRSTTSQTLADGVSGRAKRSKRACILRSHFGSRRQITTRPTRSGIACLIMALALTPMALDALDLARLVDRRCYRLKHCAWMMTTTTMTFCVQGTVRGQWMCHQRRNLTSRLGCLCGLVLVVSRLNFKASFLHRGSPA